MNSNAVKAWIQTNGTILCVEKSFEDVFGFSPEEVIGRQYKDLVVEQDEIHTLMATAQVKQGGRLVAHMGMEVVSASGPQLLHMLHSAS